MIPHFVEDSQRPRNKTSDGVLEAVFNQERSEKEDVIFLSNNEVIRGRVRNEKIGILTPYGQITLAADKCAGISFEGLQANKEEIVTKNFNRYTGIITDPNIFFNIGSSELEIVVRKEKVKFILFKRASDENKFTVPDEKTNLFVMCNGDLLTGKPLENDINVQNDFGQISISFSEIRKIEMQSWDNVDALIAKTDGNLLKGKILLEEITLNLDVGFTVQKVFKKMFSIIFIGDGNTLAFQNFGGPKTVQGEFEGLFQKSPDMEIITNSIGMKMKRIEPGFFMMGSVNGENDEKPLHKVAITKPYYIGIYPVSQAEYMALMGRNPSKFHIADAPVEMISWNDAKQFCENLSKKEGIEYRFPTEAEWEYACRAGTASEFYWGDVVNKDYLWFGSNSGSATHPVGQKNPNAWGLFDMSGNVWEWCEDWYNEMYVPGEQNDPKGPSNGQYRVLRGGSWFNVSRYCRSARRFRGGQAHRVYTNGFRVVRSGVSAICW